MPARIDPAVAEADMRRAGVQPLAPYPGSTTPWQSQCLNCGTIVTPSLASVRKGQSACRACAVRRAADAMRVPDQVADTEMRQAGYLPQEPYPGKVGARWRCLHEECGREVTPRLADIRRGVGGCHACAMRGLGPTGRLTADAATELLDSADFEPTGPYPGSTRPWPSVHTRCGYPVALSVADIRAGHGCPHCAAGRGLEMAAPAQLYVAVNKNLKVTKIGITGNGDRLRRLTATGWTVTAQFDLPTARQALDTERQVLRHLRQDLALPFAAAADSAPGYTETVSTAHLSSRQLADIVAEALREAGSLPDAAQDPPVADTDTEAE
ncbi:hypothetical protein ACWCXH_34130 [Kitasatospora sp. NPDC001660]